MPGEDDDEALQYFALSSVVDRLHGFRLCPGHTGKPAGARRGTDDLPQRAARRAIHAGPTGYAFVYVLAEGWKFVGRIDDTGH